MIKRPSFIRWGITAKFFVFSSLVMIALGAILAMMLVSFQQIDTLTTTMLDENLSRIIANSRSGQELTSLFADLVTAIFSNQRDANATNLQTLRERLNALSSQEANTDLRAVLQQFTQQLSTALEQSTLIKQQMMTLTTLEDDFVFELEMLEDVLNEKIETIEGNPLALNQLKQLQVMPTGYRNSFLQIIKQVNALEVAGSDDLAENAPPRVVTELTSLMSRLQLILENKDPDIQQQGQQLMTVLTSYHDGILQLHAAQRAFQEQLTQASESKRRALAMLSERDEESVQTAGTIRGSIRARIQTSRQFTIALASVIGAILLMISSRAIVTIRPLATMGMVARQISNGDLTAPLSEHASRDEIGVLALAFRDMQTKIAEVVRDVKLSAQDVAQRSREMNAVAEEMSQGAAQQAAATEEVSSSMQEMAANINQTTENTKITVAISMKSAEDARAGRQAVADIITAMQTIADRIFVVQEIASQTNMLSLNATIEAAKAEEYGKGFSVVASSVRDLARASREAADDIRALVQSCLTLSVQAGDVLQRLVPNSEKTAELVQEINSASQEQSHGVDQVNLAMQQLDTTTQRNAATAKEVATTAENLADQADALQQAMAFFTVKEAPRSILTEEIDLLSRIHDLETQLAEIRGVATAAHASVAGAPSAKSSQKAPKPPESTTDDHDQEFERY